jgi:hypothetical protein
MVRAGHHRRNEGARRIPQKVQSLVTYSLPSYRNARHLRIDDPGVRHPKGTLEGQNGAEHQLRQDVREVLSIFIRVIYK